MVLLTPSILSCSISPSTSSYTSLFTRTRHQKKAKSPYSDDSSNSSVEHLLLSKDQSVIDYRCPAAPPRRQTWGLLSFRSFAKQSQSQPQEEKNQRAFYLLAAATNVPLGSSVKSGNIAKMSSSFPGSGDGMFGAQTQGQVQGERRRSFGIGGAGNIRRPSEVIYPPRERRRSSVWSGTSGSLDEKKGMFGSWFGFGSGSGSGSRSEGEKK